MEVVFLNLFNMSIAASWVILAVVILRVILKRAPKSIRRILWAIVGIRLVLPFSLESFLSLIPSAETISPYILNEEISVIHSRIGVLNQTVNTSVSDSLALNTAVGANAIQVVLYMASVVWIIGILSLLLYSVIGYVRLRRRVADAVIFRDNFRKSEKVTSPFVLGIFHPRIYLPFGMDDESLAYVLAHEREHIRCHDHWIKPAGFLLLTIYWFNPLIWIAYILFCRDIELACDEHVIKKMSLGDKKAYAKALLTCSTDCRPIFACPLAFGEVGVKNRIISVINYKRPVFWVSVVAIVACIIVAVCFLTNPNTSEDPAKVIGEYDTGSLGGAFVTSGNPAYNIGMNAYGMPVFYNSDAAFYAILEDCADGFAYLSNEIGLPAITKLNYEVYKTYGWQTGTSDEALRKQCMEISQFFDIYENSFSTFRAVAVNPTGDDNDFISFSGDVAEGGQNSANTEAVSDVHLLTEFYESALKPYEDCIPDHEYMDLDANGTAELLVYNPGASKSMGCEIYTVEDGEVKSFNGNSIAVYYATGIKTTLAPLSAHFTDIILWANPSNTQNAAEYQRGRFIQCEDVESGQSGSILLSQNGNETHFWSDIYFFSSAQDGTLQITKMAGYEYKSHDYYDNTSGTDLWYVNENEVSKEEHDRLVAGIFAGIKAAYGVSYATDALP